MYFSQFTLACMQLFNEIRAGADLTAGHSCSGRRGPWEAGPWRPRASGAPEG